jgi:two-component system, chemotaxis family, sensor kinase CheA
MDMTKYQELFFAESREHLLSMNSLLLEMENNSFDAEKMGKLFRAAHSIKGMAATMGFSRTAKLAHQLENWLSTLQKKEELLPHVVEKLLEGIELLEDLINGLEAKEEEREIDFFLQKSVNEETGSVSENSQESSPQKNQPAQPAKLSKNITLHIHLKKEYASPVEAVELITLKLGSVAELISSDFSEDSGVRQLKIQLRTGLPADVLRKIVEKIQGVESVVFPFALSAQKAVAKPPGPLPKSVRMSTDVLDYLNNITGELITTRHRLEAAAEVRPDPGLEESLAELSRQIADLQHHVRKIRMMPIEHITTSLPRFVRDLSKETGKTIQLEMEGENVELDRAILEALADPLLHLIRNAADHGIEKEGTVSIIVTREQDHVILKVRDNGKGIDAEAVREKIARMNLLTKAQIAALSHNNTLQMICHPGFSTAPRVTKVSGRGVGMDIVKSAVNNLGGSLDIKSETGTGTEMILKIPLHVAIIHILLVEAGQHTVGIPITQVLSTLEIKAQDLLTSEKRPIVDLTRQSKDADEENETAPVVFLGELLGLEKPQNGEKIQLVLTECGGRKVGIGVDKLIGKKEVYVKSLGFPLQEVQGLSGATILGDGKVFFILDIQSLLQRHPIPDMAAN